MERGQIVALATVVIPPENTPQKKRSETLIAHPRWRYIGPADTIRFEWQIGQWWLGTFDGITSRQYKTFSQPASPALAEFSTGLPAISLSPLSPRAEPYICEIWFKDKFSDLRVIVENCVKIIEVPPPSDLYLPAPGFEATPGTYNLGDRVPWSMVYQYKGKAQGGWLTISLGTGVYPSFFTKHTFSRVSVSFDEAMDWTLGNLSGNFTLPTTLERGQTYSVRAKLETADGAAEIDTDWGVITVQVGYMLTTSVSPSYAGSIEKVPDLPRYEPGTGVLLKAYRSDWAIRNKYYFDHWSGDAFGTWPEFYITMDSNKSVTAHFKPL